MGIDPRAKRSACHPIRMLRQKQIPLHPDRSEHECVCWILRFLLRARVTMTTNCWNNNGWSDKATGGFAENTLF